MRSEGSLWVVRGAGLTLGVVLVLTLGVLLVAAREVVLLVFLAVLLGAALEPVVAWIRGRTGMPRGPAILIVYACFLVIVVGVAVFVIPAAVVQLGNALGQLPAFLETLKARASTLRPTSLADGIAALIDAVEAPFRPGRPPDPDSVLQASILVGSAGAALVTLLFLVFFWLTERSRLQRYALAFVPASRRGGVRAAWNEVESRLGFWARGQLTLMATIGVATGVAYSLIGLPAALLLALIAAICEVIPIVGPLLGAIPALVMATTISPQTALLTLVVYGVIQVVEGNILVPMIMRNSVGLSPFLVLVSLLAGSAAAGILGAIVAVPLVAGITVVLERLQVRRHPVPIDPSAVKPPDEEARDELESLSPDSPAPARREAREPGRAAGNG